MTNDIRKELDETIHNIVADEITGWLDDKQFEVEILFEMGRAKLLAERISKRLTILIHQIISENSSRTA